MVTVQLQLKLISYILIHRGCSQQMPHLHMVAQLPSLSRFRLPCSPRDMSLSASRQEKRRDPANAPSQKNNQTASSYFSLVTVAAKQVGKCSPLYRRVAIHNKICSFTKEGA